MAEYILLLLKFKYIAYIWFVELSTGLSSMIMMFFFLLVFSSNHKKRKKNKSSLVYEQLWMCVHPGEPP